MIQCTFEHGNQNSLRHAVVDNLVIQDGKILLVKRANKLLESGKWALIGGFVERDETLEQAVQRETLEETGYTLTDVQLFRIIDRPDRPSEDRQNIAFVFLSAAIKKVGSADKESDEQQWFSLSALPPDDEIAFDHFSNIRLYKEYLHNRFPLPKLG